MDIIKTLKSYIAEYEAGKLGMDELSMRLEDTASEAWLAHERALDAKPSDTDIMIKQHGGVR